VTEDLAAVLVGLTELHDSGALDDTEFVRAKSHVLGATAASRRPTTAAGSGPAAAGPEPAAGSIPAPAPSSGPGPVAAPSRLRLRTVVAAIAIVASVIGLPIAAVLTSARSAPSAEAEVTAPSSTNVPAVTMMPAPSAAELLDESVTADRPQVEALVDSWVPQLMAARPGSTVDGVLDDTDEILRRVAELRTRFPAVLLLRSNDYTSFRLPDHYIAVMPLTSASAADAIAWCAAQDLGPDDCFAKRLSHSSTPSDSTVYQH
jgi:hypothetical protein